MCPDMDYDFDEECESKPAWFENDVLDEPYFCDEFVMEHPMRYVGGRFYTREGSIQDEESIRQEIYWKLNSVIKTGVARKTTALLELLKLQLILSAKRKPADREDDPFLADKLCAEIEAIFFWCLEGLKRLVANNFKFTESEQTKANREASKQEANNVLQFLRSEGYIRQRAEGCITSADLYSIYQMWCMDNAFKPLSPKTVSMTLKKHVDEFRLEHDNHIHNALGKRVNGFWGIEPMVIPTRLC